MNTGIIESKQYIPWVLRQSRDMQAFCKLVDLLLNNFKTRTDYYTDMISFDNCPDEYLRFLASYVGYKYDNAESYDSNRLIIKNYPNLIHNRGSELGIALATALSVNALGQIDKVEALNMFNIDSEIDENGNVRIYVFFPNNLSKTRDLIEVVRPAGVGIKLVPADIIQTIDGIKIVDWLEATKSSYDITRYSVSNTDKVGFAEVTNQDRD
jgi:hypothetical protein